jgi:hypothetical protein
MKTEMDVERLLHWAYRDELSKRQTSAAEGIWDRMRDSGQLGGIEPRGDGGAQRYASFGLPDPDAELIEAAVGRLDDMVVDWNLSFDTIAAELSALVTVNDIARRPMPGKTAVSEWTTKSGRRMRVEDRPRDVILPGAIRTKALVTMHAIRGSRPDWHDDPPQPHMVQATKGPHASVVGECKGRNLYTSGSYCPLRWEPSPLSIVMARAEYAAWHAGLVRLANDLDMRRHAALPPRAPSTPWIDPTGDTGAVFVQPAAMPRAQFGSPQLPNTRVDTGANH